MLAVKQAGGEQVEKSRGPKLSTPRTTLGVTSTAVDLTALATRIEALLTDDVEAIIANQVASSRIEANLTGETVKRSQYGVIRQGERSCFLSPFNQKPEDLGNGFNPHESDGLDLQI